MTLMGCALALFCGVGMFVQSKDEVCLLDTAKNGATLKIRGEAFPGGHDTFIRPIVCVADPANRVILVWADDPSVTPRSKVRRDAAFFEFNRLLRATYPIPNNSVGSGQLRYQAIADFEGRLEVANAAGLKLDPKSKKVVGIQGFGHPIPFTRFRFVATGVSRIVSTEQQPRQ